MRRKAWTCTVAVVSGPGSAAIRALGVIKNLEAEMRPDLSLKFPAIPPMRRPTTDRPGAGYQAARAPAGPLPLGWERRRFSGNGGRSSSRPDPAQKSVEARDGITMERRHRMRAPEVLHRPARTLKPGNLRLPAAICPPHSPAPSGGRHSPGQRRASGSVASARSSVSSDRRTALRRGAERQWNQPGRTSSNDRVEPAGPVFTPLR